ncbi:E3 ubiquitin-protein ligase TRAIP-like [Glossina fuscipes]|uniref:E3 ubiquitin-protein ligase TRAIP-like n=1 Tax=Glossina fuscipes TaxID=7396 RepID=A0A8U0WN73_9MUSC|nr:E3 ubiquitin-protein ligase TRAIP-like [Glossina fuscipes]
MSSSSGVICSICIESFTASDTIYVITCGHLFHAQCIEDWKLRSSNCPDCRFVFISMEKVFLNFEENYISSGMANERRAKLQSYEIELKELRDQLRDSEKNFLYMQEQYTVSNEKVHKLIKELNHIKTDEVTCSAVQREELHDFQKECRNVKTCVQSTFSIVQNNYRDIQREMERMRELTAQCYVAMKLNDDTHECDETSSLCVKEEFRDYVVIVKRYPLNKLIYPLIDNIYALASAMNVKITVNDIHEVLKIDCNSGTAPETVCLQLQFKRIKARNKFVNNQQKLQKCKDYGSIGIYEYKEGDVKNSLYHYAKAQLRSYGFAAVFTQNGQIMAIYDRKIANKPIRIRSKKQVDRLVKQYK